MMLPGKSGKHRRTFHALLVSLAVLGIIATLTVAAAVHKSRKEGIIDRAHTIARAIPPGDVLALKGDESDLQNPAYGRLKDLVTDLRMANRDIRFVYLNGRDGQNIFFYVDSEDPLSDDYSSPGESYGEASDLMFRLFATGESGFEIERDRWGYWVSALAPVLHPATGEVIALAGIDIPAEDHFMDIAAYALTVVLFSSIILSTVIGLQLSADRERRFLDEKAEFLSVASHEIRSPLTGIRWASETILTRPASELDPKVRKLVSLMHENTVTVIGRINNLLSMSAFERGKQDVLDIRLVKLRPMVDQVVSNLELAAGVRNVKLSIDDSLAAHVTVRCDEGAMRNVLENLISNAIKYTRPDTNVEISFDHEGGEDRIWIRDEGEGIVPEEREKIFKGYHRAPDARKSRVHGTGLGLYLADRIIKMHKGRIAVDSKIGKGTTFTVVLPS